MSMHPNRHFFRNLLMLLVFVLLLSSCDNSTQSADYQNHKKINSDSIMGVEEVHQTIDTAYYQDLLTGRLNITQDSNFVVVPSRYTDKRIYMHRDAANALVRMIDQAAIDGVRLNVISGYRSFDDQARIWNRKWENTLAGSNVEKCKKIMLYSAMPKTSRHHWGTDVDLNALENNYFEAGRGLKELNWLDSNAVDYGFRRVYSDKSNGRRGYEMERWHWSYTPLAYRFQDLYNELIDYSIISGFPGAESAQSIRAIEDYVNGIE
jgi:D-alanyl-D-alanine carboxypeptidase